MRSIDSLYISMSMRASFWKLPILPRLRKPSLQFTGLSAGFVGAREEYKCNMGHRHTDRMILVDGHLSCSLNFYLGECYRAITGDARSLDYGATGIWNLAWACPGILPEVQGSLQAHSHRGQVLGVRTPGFRVWGFGFRV